MKTVTLKNYEIQNLYDRLNSAVGLKGIELLYARSRTMKYLKDVVDAFAMDTVIPETEKFKELQEELTKAYRELATKDGKVQTKEIIVPNGTDTPKKIETLDLNFNELKVIKVKDALEAKYKEDIDKRKADEKLYKEKMETGTSEVILFYFPLKYAPVEQSQFDAVQDLIMPSTDFDDDWNTLFEKVRDGETKETKAEPTPEKPIKKSK